MSFCSFPRPDERRDASRWAAVWVHHDSLLRLARSRVTCEEDAEDVVHEALLLAASDVSVDLDTAGAWMNRVVRNKTADLSRERSYQAHRERYQVRLHAGEVPLEEQVCDRDEARSIASRLDTVPVRQRHALLLAADGLSGGEIAARMQATPKAVENLLRKGRSALRASACSVALAWGGRQLGWRRPATAGALATAGLVVLVVIGPQRDAGAPLAQEPSSASLSAASTAQGRAPGTAGPEAAAVRQAAVRPVARRQVPRAGQHRTVVKAVRLRVGDDELRTPVVTQHGPLLDVLPSAERCLRERPVVSSTFVGCPPER
jgi:RNA polymerase sigma factor (sigma-70 family)